MKNVTRVIEKLKIAHMGYLFDEECIYTGRGRVGKFKFVFVRRLHVAATLFRPEFIYYYITCFLTMLILQGKTTT